MGVLAGQSDSEHVGLPQPPLCSHGCSPAVSLLRQLRDVRVPRVRLPNGPQPPRLLPCGRLSCQLSSSDPQPSWLCCHQGCRQVGQLPGDQRENGAGRHCHYDVTSHHCQGRVHHPAERTLRPLLRRRRQVQRLHHELHRPDWDQRLRQTRHRNQLPRCSDQRGHRHCFCCYPGYGQRSGLHQWILHHRPHQGPLHRLHHHRQDRLEGRQQMVADHQCRWNDYWLLHDGSSISYSLYHVVIFITPKLRESQPENMFGVQKNIS